MKLFCFAAFTILLILRVEQVSSKTVRKTNAENDLYEYNSDFSRQKQEEPSVRLLTDNRPNKLSQLDSYNYNPVYRESTEVNPYYAYNLGYDHYPKKISNWKYQPSIYEMSDDYVKQQRPDFPNELGAEKLSEMTYYTEGNYDAYNEIGDEEYDENVSDGSLNQVVDFLLNLVNKDIVAKGKDQIPIPNMSEEFEKRIGPVKVHGKFDAQNGWFKNLSTIQRTGDVVATTRGADTLVVTCEMGLATMAFGFESYQANLAGISVRGHMTGSVASNSVTLQVAVTVAGEKCNTSLERLTLDRFDGINVDLTGLGNLSWLLNSIAGWVTKHFKDDIVSSIDTNLRKAVTDILSKFHCSDLMDMLVNMPSKETLQEVSVVMV